MKAAASPAAGDCPLCRHVDGVPVWEDAGWRLVRTTDTPAHPAFWRLVLKHHAAELSDLAAEERRRAVDLLAAIEAVLRAELQPVKINLASLGNLVPHLHWHVVARFTNDSHFPQPIWAPAQRPADDAALRALAARLPAVDASIAEALSRGFTR
jgi:diadenosine tetraphosphate (Ap4A) HIT family hydrolase